MPEPETVPSVREIRVVVASPADVEEERRAVEGMILELNTTVARSMSLHIRMSIWETDQSARFVPSGHPELVDSGLRLNDCDLFIVILWSRLGEAGPDGATGTEQELRMALESFAVAGRPRIVAYFRADAPHLSTSAQADQYAQVLRLKESLPGGVTFSSFGVTEGHPAASFRDLFQQHLIQFLSETAASSGTAKSVPSSSSSSERERWLARIERGYRDRLGAAFQRWDLSTIAVSPLTGLSEPISFDLDAIYERARFVPRDGGLTAAPDSIEIDPKRVLHLKSPVLLQGQTGSGKTTWMRWTFRELLDKSEALPLFLDCRRLARKWVSNPDEGPHRSIEAYLDAWVASYGCPADAVTTLMAQSSRKIILFVDGWDELGELGEELRPKVLGLMRAYPGMNVIVTSRLYGVDLPSRRDGFSPFDIQPLTDRNINRLTGRFYRLAYGPDSPVAAEVAHDFALALDQSANAGELARSPMMLTMMLGIFLHSPLPDQRYKIYERCIEHLLSDLPRKRAAGGVQPSPRHWWPENDQKRIWAAAKFAQDLYQGSVVGSRQAVFAMHRDRALSVLDRSWSQGQKAGFLRWMEEAAGLLTTSADLTVSFSHTTFGDYLLARYLRSSLEGNARDDFLKNNVNHGLGWEPLRLWAALVEEDGPDKLVPGLHRLGATDPGLCLAGTLMADGLGPDTYFEHWHSTFARVVQRSWSAPIERVARAWLGSSRADRRDRLRISLHRAMEDSNWAAWYRLRDWCKKVGIGVRMPLPRKGSNSAVMVKCLESGPEAERDFAVGRVLAGGWPTWPGQPWEFALLQVWPSNRRIIGLRLQTLASFDFPETGIKSVAQRLLTVRSEVSAENEPLARRLSHLFELHLTKQFSKRIQRSAAGTASKSLIRTLAWDIGSAFSQGFGGEMASSFMEPLARDLATEFSRDFLEIWNSAWADDLSADTARTLSAAWAVTWQRRWPGGSQIPRGWPLDWANAYGLSTKIPGVLDFAKADLLSYGWHCPRARIAQQSGRDSRPEIQLMAEACRISSGEPGRWDDFEKCLDNCRTVVDPLWPALARLLAGRSEEGDHDYLREVARKAEEAKPPLRWGLQYLVRGDVVLSTGVVRKLEDFMDSGSVAIEPELAYLGRAPGPVPPYRDASPGSSARKLQSK